MQKITTDIKKVSVGNLRDPGNKQEWYPWTCC